MTQDQYQTALQDHPGETPVVRAPILTILGYDAEDLGVVIAEAVGNANDVDGVDWRMVGKLVIEALA